MRQLKESIILIFSFLLSFCFIIRPVAVFGQGHVQEQSATITGKIFDEQNRPVAHATLQLEGFGLKTMSDQQGNFTIRQVPFGQIRLLCTSLEIDSLYKNLLVQRAQVRLDISAKRKQSEHIETVSIQSQSQKQKVENSGFASSVIETKEAALLNVTTNELLDRSVGVRVRQNGGEGSPIEYNLNGLSGSSISLFIDGIEVSTYGSSFNLNNIPPSLIERIEIYKGVLPAHLSGNYLGGAINVIMKKDLSPQQLNFSLSYGSFNTYKADLSANFRATKSGLTLRVFGFLNHSDNDYEIWGKFSKYTQANGRVTRYYRTQRPNDKFDSKGARVEAGFVQVPWADKLFLGLQISNSYKEIPHGVTMTRPYFGRFNEFDARIMTLQYSKNHFLLDGLQLQIQGVQSWRSTYLQDTVSRIFNWDGTPLMAPPNADGEIKPLPSTPGKGQQGDAVMSDIARSITNVRSNLSYMLTPGHKISLDHKYERGAREDQDLIYPDRSAWITSNLLTTHILSANYEADYFSGRVHSHVFGKYALYHTRQRIPVSQDDTGVVYHEQSSTRDNQAFGAAVSVKIFSKSYLLMSAEQSYIMPTDRHIYGEPENNLLPNQDIMPERALNYNLGARWSTQTGTHKWSAYGNFFWRNAYDKITLQTRVDPVLEGRENQVEDIQVTQFVNLSRTQSVGFEGEILYDNSRNIALGLNLSKFNSLFKVQLDERGNPHSLYNKQIPNEPSFTVNAHGLYRLHHLFLKSSELQLHYHAGYVAPYSTIWIASDWFTTPTQFTNDLGVSYKFPGNRLVLSMDAKNIGNAEVYDNFGVQKPGRAFYVKINYSIHSFNKKSHEK